MLLCVERPELHTLNTDVMYINVGTGNPNCSRMPKATIRFKDSRMTTLSVSVLHVNNLSVATVRIPAGLGHLIKPDGTIASASWATVIKSGSGIRTAYPIIL